MMSSKRVSQLAMLSILLTFTHTVGHANLTVPSNFSSEISAQPLCSLNSEAEKQESVSSLDKKSSKTSWKKRKISKASFTDKANERERCENPGKKERFHFKQQKISQGKIRRSSKETDLGLRKFFSIKRSSVKASSKEANSSLLKTIIIKQKEDLLQKDAPVENSADVTLANFDISKISQEERDRLFQELAREQRVSKRKSSRSALEARLKENQIPRGGSVTSTLRYDMEKAAAIKVKRNASVNSRVREQRTAYSRRASGSSRTQADTTHLSGEPSARNSSQGQSEKQGAADMYFQEASAAGNTNVNSYLEAKQYRCNSEETDWPCASCVSKRRANSSMSICTLVVTVIAIIIGAIIICNASADSTTQSGGATNP